MGLAGIALALGAMSAQWTMGMIPLLNQVARLKRKLVGVEGFEPPTSCSQSRRATRLRYTPRRPEPLKPR